MKTRLQLLLVLLVLALLHLRLATALAQGTAFTYQGRLTENGSPAGGSLVGGPVTPPPTVVNDGLFSVKLDFGSGIFTGAERWLEMAVRTNGGYAFIVLEPRQQVSAAPYAVTAREVTGSVAA